MGTSGPEAFRLAERIVADATQAQLTVATAESCTGGLVCGAMTDVAGSSAVVLGGVCSYAIPVKERVLGVSDAITQDPAVGVVSSPCAEAMAAGVRRLLGADIAVSTTGIAGPGGAEPGKPVGTVWFAIDSELGTRSVCRCFDGDRGEVRRQATACALTLVIEEIEALGADA